MSATEQRPLAIASITQTDNHHFVIVWSDGAHHRYRLCDLQRRCPCAGCSDEDGRRPATAPTVSDDVRARRISSVGRYALQIAFTSGCCHGLYRYDYLYHLGQGAMP